MSGQTNRPTQEPCDNYWIEKLHGYEGNHGFLAHGQHARTGERGTVRKRIAAEHPADLQPTGGGSRLHELSLCLAGLGLLARRYGAVEPLLIAAPAFHSTAERSRNPLFFRIDVDEASSAGRYLSEVLAEVGRSRDNAGYSMSGLLGGLALDSVDPVYRHSVGFRHHGWMADFPAPAAWSLLFEVRCEDDDNYLLLVHDSGLIPPQLAEQLSRHLLCAIELLRGDSRRRLTELELLNPGEKHQILRELNDTVASYPEKLSLHALFERQADLRPDAMALVSGSGFFTFAGVDRLAGRLAWYLRDSLGVRPGDPVALLVPRCEQMVLGILGILKAGAAYVPIDPTSPPEIVAGTLEDSGAKALLLASDLLHRAGAFPGDLFFMDLQLSSLDAAPRARVAVEGASAAYVIYTSGSTGKHKGVVVGHGAIVNTLLWRGEAYGFGPGEVTLQLPSYAFDSSVEDIFGMLAAGGTLILPAEEQRVDSRSIKLMIPRHGVTHFLVTPSFHRAFLLEVEAGLTPVDLSSLRVVTIAGEEIAPDLVREHSRCLPGVPLVNEYGPTENAVCSTVCRLHEAQATIPIGRPIANVSAFVLDPWLRLLPKGARGELFVAGTGLARGYLNRPDLTAERLLPSPLSDWTGDRLYRTGDLASWSHDGHLEFWGRVDDQVKVRGFRIELGEITAVLRSHPRVADVAVLCGENARGEKYLIAYLVGPDEPEISAIRAFLGSKLPRFMVPDFFRLLPALPVNSHGKVDRRRLAALALFAGAVRTEPAPEMTPLESALLESWQEILGGGDLGLDHDFFEHGGNSLAVLAIIACIRERLGIELATSDVYAFPTVRKLAAKIAVGSASTTSPRGGKHTTEAKVQAADPLPAAVRLGGTP
jgi:amino acid adenylation domain-containing protein